MKSSVKISLQDNLDKFKLLIYTFYYLKMKNNLLTNHEESYMLIVTFWIISS